MKGPWKLFVFKMLIALAMLPMHQVAIYGQTLQDSFGALQSLANFAFQSNPGLVGCAGETRLSDKELADLKYHGMANCSREALRGQLHQATLGGNIQATYEAYTDLGEHYWYFEDFQQAEEYLSLSEDLNEVNRKEISDTSPMLLLSARCLHLKGQLDRAYLKAREAKDLALRHKNIKVRIEALGLLAYLTRDAFANEGRTPASYALEANNLARTSSLDQLQMKSSYWLTALTEGDTQLGYFRKTISQLQNTGDVQTLIKTINHGGIIANSKNLPELALRYFELELKLCEHFGLDRQLQHSLIQLYWVYRSLKNYDKAFECLRRANAMPRYYAFDDFNELFAGLYRDLGMVDSSNLYYQNAVDFNLQTNQIRSRQLLAQSIERELEKIDNSPFDDFWIFISILVLIAAVAALVWLYFQRLNKLQQQPEKGALTAPSTNGLHPAINSKRSGVGDDPGASPGPKLSSHLLHQHDGLSSNHLELGINGSTAMHTPRDKAWLVEVSAILNDRPNISVKELALALFMSRRQLQRKIKELLNLTPSEFLLEQRLQMAMTKIEEENIESVKALALACGWSNPYYFSKQFQKRFGKQPSELMLQG